MNETVAVRDVMDRTYVGVSEGDPVAGVASLMDEEGVDHAVVLRGNKPAGVLRASDIVALVAAGEEPEDATVEDVMTDPPVSIDGDARLADAVDVIAGDGARRVIVTEGDAVAGVLTDHDVVTARAIRPSEDDPDEIPTAEHATPGSEVYGSQGVCEVCGALTRTLTDDNGQLVCADCLDM